MKIKLVRWDFKRIKAVDLYPQPCNWGGFQSELLSFVPLDSKWEQECEEKHGTGLVPSFYTLGLTMSYSGFIREAEMEADKGFSRLTALGIFVTLEDGYEIVEIRFNQPSPLQYLLDTDSIESY